jgi:hypothetical protein
LILSRPLLLTWPGALQNSALPFTWTWGISKLSGGTDQTGLGCQSDQSTRRQPSLSCLAPKRWSLLISVFGKTCQKG